MEIKPYALALIGPMHKEIILSKEVHEPRWLDYAIFFVPSFFALIRIRAYGKSL